MITSVIKFSPKKDYMERYREILFSAGNIFLFIVFSK